MRWLADECISLPVVRELRAKGHDVTYMAEMAAGATDAVVLRLAHAETRILLTEDKDFGDLVFRSKMPAPGVVLLRLDSETTDTKSARLDAVIAEFGDLLLGRYIVVEARRIRARPLLRSMT